MAAPRGPTSMPSSTATARPASGTPSRQLASLGHRRIAHIAAPQDLTFAHLRRKGWLAGLEEAGPAEPIEYTAQPTEAGGYEAAQWLLQQSAPPTAFLCATDSMAIGALSALKERGLRRRTRDRRDRPRQSARLRPSPIRRSRRMEIAAPDVGRQLAEMLIARLGGREPRELQTILPVRQVPRATHGRRTEPDAARPSGPGSSGTTEGTDGGRT